MFVPRHVREVPKSESPVETPALPLSEFRGKGAWVLLGEPGSGKSVALEEEAGKTGGLYISIAEFLCDDPDTGWQGKPLFLDGLDETRAGGDNIGVLFKIRAHLKKLGNPPFRMACRAADWFGSTDRQTIEGASPDGRLAVLVLEPLSSGQVIDIISNNYHEIACPEKFIKKATDHRLEDLLSNPQTLQLLVKAIRDGQWPRTLEETYRLACRQLAGEDNKIHRTKQLSQPISVDQVLQAAGQLCAILLLADKQGFALDAGASDRNFPATEDFCPPDLMAAKRAAGRKLFRLIPNREERVVPSHRGIAEYLAALWLAEQIQDRGLPLRRVLQLLVGHEDRTVAGLRGLYGWLALFCQTARPHLIEADPLTIIVYGDVKPMPSADKRNILDGLRREARQNLAFFWQIPSKPFGALADRELAGDFAAALESTESDEAMQSFIRCVLDILVEGNAIPDLAGTIKTLILDETRPERVRRDALLAWLKQLPPAEEALALLDSINEGRVADPDDTLAGFLLGYLYPQIIEPEALLGYLHAPKDHAHTGSFSWFWGYEFPKIAPDSHLPVLLDQLAARTDLSFTDEVDFGFDYRQLSGILLTRGIETHGEKIEDIRLFTWLGICVNRSGESLLDKEHLEAISRWLTNHPGRYKAMLALCYKQCESAEDVGYCIYTRERRLHDPSVPEDLGIWHLERASQVADDTLAKYHLAEAVSALIQQRGNAGLSLETLEAWGSDHPERQHWLPPLLKCEISEWRKEHSAKVNTRKQQHAERRRARSIAVSKHLSAIRSGIAHPSQLSELAFIWMNLYRDIYGETPKERFDSYCENGAEVLAAAEAGFFLCPERDDLPSVAEIINLHIGQREHLIRRPCLIGMELRWQKDPSYIESLNDDTLRRMVAFRLTYSVGGTPEWFTYLVRERPSPVAEVLVDYAGATLKAGKEYVSGISPLTLFPDFQEVAKIAVPQLLERFPVRAKSGQLSHLASLLKAALRYTAKQLPAIIEKKLKAKGMDVAQRVYWLTTAMLLDPARHEPALLRYIGRSWARANHLSSLLGERFADLTGDYPLSSRIIGKLIELLTPHAELGRRTGFINEAMRRGETVHDMVSYLGTLATEEAAREIERLSILPALGKLKYSLAHTRQQLRLRQREVAFRYLPVSDVARILANREPTSTADLAALVIDHLDDLAGKIRQDNSDLFRFFWTEAQPNSPKPENSCRDVLLNKLKAYLEPFGIDCLPEADHFNDKRADIRLSYRNAFELSIEIKRESNESLWTALRSQLIEKYSTSPNAVGHGIYLVLWFGRHRLPVPKDGGKKPTSPAELQTRLEAQLNPEERRRIFVRVLDVSWPAKS